MGRKRLHRQRTETTGLPLILSARDSAYWNPYVSDNGSKPLIPSSKRTMPGRSGRSQRRVNNLSRAFSTFYKISCESVCGNRHNTSYDLHRHEAYSIQTARLRADYPGFLAGCHSILDVGCGTGKLLRKIIRTNATMQALENGPREMRILGVDSNSEALRAAAAKRNLLFNHHGKLPPSLRMEFMLLDLRDLQALDLSNTCIEKSRVDLVLASDIFRWLPESERAGVLGAIRTKVASGGHLISFEFTEPPLPITEDLPKNLALRLATFGFLEPFHIGRFYQQLEDSGFERIPETKRNGHDEEHDRFPQLVSCVFRPAQRKTGK